MTQSVFLLLNENKKYMKEKDKSEKKEVVERGKVIH